DVGLRQRAAPGQAIENRTQPFRKTIEHLKTLFAPEGASRCRAVTSGLGGRSAVAIRSLARAGGK
ncbi:MAG TPA: hypothetical protein VK749_08280, partial [Xanthobacteraceae bacterium]|nr:hypothetical protein [Xanthobacteraceae bacterium]